MPKPRQTEQQEDTNHLEIQLGTLATSFKYMAEDIREMKSDFKEFKTFYQTKEQAAHDYSKLNARIDAAEKQHTDDQQDYETAREKDQERVTFYVRAFMMALITSLVTLAIGAIQFLRIKP